MLSRLKFLLACFLLWILFFEAARLLFLFYHWEKARELSFQTWLSSLFYGLRMDASAAAYLIAPVCLLIIASLFVRFLTRPVVYRIYHYIILCFVLLLTLADLEVFKAWGFRIDATPLKYLQSPQEVWASISHLPLLLIFTVFLVVWLGLCWIFKKFIDKMIARIQPARKPWLAVLVLLLVTGSLIIPMRGGFQLTPMNQSIVYFSKNNFANVAAVNATWNLLNGLAQGASTENPYQYLNQDKAKQIVDSLYQSRGSIKRILKTDRPNVIVVIWESFTEKALHKTIDGKPITPRFNELKNEGIYFSNAFASGDRTDKGVAAVLSGYPAMNKVSIIRFPKKSAQLSTLSGFFKERGYVTSFYYGGETEFANIKSYLLQGQYDQLIDKNEFSVKDQNSKWGAHDGVVAERLFSDLAKQPTPFFVTWLTLSSHEPFETPTPSVFSGKDHTSLFANSLHYTDEVFYNFIKRCEQEPWWENTLLVVVADHGHTLPDPSDWISNFRIPMLWLGGALAEKGMVVEDPVSQLDLAATLTGQLGAERKFFPFSKNIFDSTASRWAYFSFNDGFGFVQRGKQLVFDNVGKQLIYQNGNITPGDIEAAKAMQQVSFEDYVGK